MTANADQPHVGLVVEGLGDGRSVPILLRNYRYALGDYRDLLGKPVSCNGRNNALKERGIESRAAIVAARPGCVGVLVVLDGEGDPVGQLGPALTKRAQAVTPKSLAVVLATPKYERWLVASAETLGLASLTYNPSRDCRRP